MSLTASNRLLGALLVEMVSGHYVEGKRFLSHRQIMQHWRVGTTTAHQAWDLLQAADVVRVRDRSGHYLPEGFRERALLSLHRKEGTETGVAPLQHHRLGMKVLLQRRAGHAMRRVAAVMVLQGDRRLRRQDCDDVLARNPAASLTARGIFLEAEERHIAVDFFLCDGSRDSERHTLARVLNARPDGVLIINRKTSFQAKPFGESFLQRGIPVVVLYGESEGSDMISVNFNNVGMGVNAAETFLRNGHRRLGVLVWRAPTTNYCEDRLRGFRLRATEKKGVTVTEFRLSEQPDDFLQAAARLRRERITALFSTTHELFAGFLPALKESGIRVPADVSVLMCSSISAVKGFPTPVDTLIQDFVLLGRMAFRALEEYCSGEVAQKAYLLDPIVDIHGTVRGFPRASGKSSRH
jgi:DNA-binding LacI/PurR family transcriptional regulator/DNA-binding transcriptional regulator YhcF (GntR family)